MAFIDNIQRNVSEVLSRAMPASVFTAAGAPFARPLLSQFPPNSTDASAITNLGTGYGSAIQPGNLGMAAPIRLKVYPLGQGAPGDTFTMRVYIWEQYGRQDTTVTYMPSLVAELDCVLANIPGWSAMATVTNTENMCDTIAIGVQATPVGNLGQLGEINAWPGSGTAAFAAIDLRGARFASFDFANPSSPSVGMNALYCYL